MAFELKHSNLLQQNVKGLKNQTPKPKFKLHDEKYVQGIQKFARFKLSFKLQEFELHKFNCILTLLQLFQKCFRLQ